jgi:hypothetical protein
MKTIKIIISTAGFALVTICFGQLFAQNNDDLLFYSSYYDLASNRWEHRVDQFPARTTSGDHFEAPRISRTYFIPSEVDMGIEEWMTKPFESSIFEEELLLKSWMVSPFESNYYEADLIIEAWMTRPFESHQKITEEIEEEIEIEAWMSTIWI